MSQSNYFELFRISPSFHIDEAALKKSFLKLSMEYHPDFHTDQSEEAQSAILEKSSQVNEGFKTLKSFDSRFKYVLTLHNVDFEEGKQSLPQMFLMEMMDFNEKLMDVQMEGDKTAAKGLQEELKHMESALYKDIEETIKSYDFETISEDSLAKLKDYYFKKKYLLRISENLDKFALT